jgi:hypothetical protein
MLAPPMAQNLAQKSEAFWKGALSGDIDSAAAKKQLASLPPDLSPATAQKIYKRYLADSPGALWPAAAGTPEPLAETLVTALAKSKCTAARVLVAAFDEGNVDALREAGAFFAFLRKSTNLKALSKRITAVRPSAPFARAAAKAVSDVKSAPDGEILTFWPLLWVAAHADEGILDALEPRVKRWGELGLLSWVRETPRGVAAPAKKKAATTKSRA